MATKHGALPPWLGPNLANAAFVDKAPAEVVAKEREKLEEFARRQEKIQGYLRDLQP